MNQAPWRLLYRVENGQRVWSFEQLWASELYELRQDGWQLWRGG